MHVLTFNCVTFILTMLAIKVQDAVKKGFILISMVTRSTVPLCFNSVLGQRSSELLKDD